VRITIVPVGLIKKYAEACDLEVPDGTTPGTLIERLAIPKRLKMVAYVNGKRRALDEPLGAGDEVKLVTLLTGG
jgi:molybdopterin converting factor small subunit